MGQAGISVWHRIRIDLPLSTLLPETTKHTPSSYSRLRRLQSGRLKEVLSMCYKMFTDSDTYHNQTVRVAALERVCLPILQHADKITIAEFFRSNLPDIKTRLSAKESRVS